MTKLVENNFQEDTIEILICKIIVASYRGVATFGRPCILSLLLRLLGRPVYYISYCDFWAALYIVSPIVTFGPPCVLYLLWRLLGHPVYCISYGDFWATLYIVSPMATFGSPLILYLLWRLLGDSVYCISCFYLRAMIRFILTFSQSLINNYIISRTV